MLSLNIIILYSFFPLRSVYFGIFFVVRGFQNHYLTLRFFTQYLKI